MYLYIYIHIATPHVSHLHLYTHLCKAIHVAQTVVLARMEDSQKSEPIIYTAELDAGAAKKQLRSLFFDAIFPAIMCPCALPMFCSYFYFQRRAHINFLQDWQVYITEHTLVCVAPTQDCNKVAIPLVNVESVEVKSSDVIINIKSSAPGVLITRVPDGVCTCTETTHSLPLRYVKNAETFAAAVRRAQGNAE